MHQYLITNGSMTIVDDLVSVTTRILFDETKDVWSIEQLTHEQMLVGEALRSNDPASYHRLYRSFLHRRDFDVQALVTEEGYHEAY